jgi:single-strand DNA-binding protein
MSTEKGRVKVIMDEQVISDKFRKKEFVIETIGDYPQEIMFQTANDKCSILDSVSVGEIVDVHYNLRGRMWKNPQGENKYFNSCDAWKVEKVISDTPIEMVEAPSDDLPF